MKPPTVTNGAAIKLSTKELSEATWPDFLKLFSQGNGWDHCFCVHFRRPRSLPKDQRLPTRKLRAARNRQEQKKLIDKSCSHGILVYENGVAVGWCQYGLREELTRIDHMRTYRVPPPEIRTGKFWRIACFVVDRKYRRRGIAGAALAAALESIKRQGGGIVEAYPVANWEGKSFGNMSTHGTVSMFKKAGFKRVAPFGNTNAVMRKKI
jgi:ribosomal protein S18 acetylase RimI-like enzyme